MAWERTLLHGNPTPCRWCGTTDTTEITRRDKEDGQPLESLYLCPTCDRL